MNLNKIELMDMGVYKSKTFLTLSLVFLFVLVSLFSYSCFKEKESEKIKYTLAITKPTGGTIDSNTLVCGDNGEICQADFDEGSIITLIATAANSDYAIGDWGGDCTGLEETCRVTMNGKKTVSKAFTAIQRTLTIDPKPTNGTVVSKPKGIKCGSGGTDCKALFDKNSKVRLTATADSVYRPGDWGGDCESSVSSNICTLVMGGNKTARKTFPFKIWVKHVVIIGLDGLGGAYVSGPKTPVIDGLMLKGAYSLTMQTNLATASAQNWSSMLNGQGTDRHHVYYNGLLYNPDDKTIDSKTGTVYTKGWLPGNSIPAPSLISILRTQRPKSVIGVFHQWPAIGKLVEEGVADKKEQHNGPKKTVEAAINFIKNNKPELTFISVDPPDGAGHSYGWYKNRTECSGIYCSYIDAVENMDKLVNDVLLAIEDAGMTKTTAVIFSSDHGGQHRLTNHGGDTYDERCIPFIITGPGIISGRIDRVLRVFDIPATAAALLGLTIPESWVGRPILDPLKDYSLPKPSSASLEYHLVNNYKKVYEDTGLGASSELTLWRPVVPYGFHSLGDIAISGSRDMPTFAVPVVKGDVSKLVRPIGYEQVWNDKGSEGEDARVGGSLWHGIAPPGYMCVGTIAVEGYDEPSSTQDMIRCIHNDFLSDGERKLIWTYPAKAGIWSCEPSDSHLAISTHTFILRRNSSDPGINLCRSLKSSSLIKQ